MLANLGHIRALSWMSISQTPIGSPLLRPPAAPFRRASRRDFPGRVST